MTGTEPSPPEDESSEASAGPPEGLARFSKKMGPWAAVIACVVALFLWGDSPPPQILTSGTSLVEGQSVLLAGTLKVQVDGRASVTVEPPEGAPSAAELLQSNRGEILDALEGSDVQVSVRLGLARVWTDAGVVVLEAGQTQRFGPETGKSN